MSDTNSRVIAGRYRLIRPLGQGAMGRVWLALDETLRREVAVKELVPPPGLTDGERQELRERSMREARAIARLDQPNVVRIHDVVHDGDEPWIVMEFVRSRPLHEVLKSEGPMSPARAATIGLGVLAALRAAHRAGLLHRDVKPANVLLADDGRVVLTDFGLAIGADDAAVTRTGVMLGSPAYLAPERAMDGAVGPASDLWSLGATLYAAVEGRTPYTRSSSVATLTALATELPPAPVRAGALLPALEGLLRKDPATRIDADEAERLLRLAAAGTTAAPGPAADPAPTVPSASAANSVSAATSTSAPVSHSAPASAAATDSAFAPVSPSNSAASAPSSAFASASTANSASAGSGSTANSASASADSGTFSTGPSAQWTATGPTAVVIPPAADTSGPALPTADAAPAGRSRRTVPLVLIAVALIGVAAAALAVGTRLNTGAEAADTPLLSVAQPSAEPSGTLAPSAASATTPPAKPSPSATPSASASPTGKPAPVVAPSPGKTTASAPAAAKPLTPVATDRPIVNRGNSMCIDVPDSNPDTTQTIHVWDCHDPAGGGEDFDLTGDGRLQIVGRCLQADGAAAGSTLHVAPCDGGWDQTFTLTDAGTLQNVKAARCIEIPGGSSTNGTKLQLADCTATDRQRWFIG